MELIFQVFYKSVTKLLNIQAAGLSHQNGPRVKLMNRFNQIIKLVLRVSKNLHCFTRNWLISRNNLRGPKLCRESEFKSEHFFFLDQLW